MEFVSPKATLTFWDGPCSVCRMYFSLNKSTSYLSLWLSLNSFCNETLRTWASLGPEARCAIEVGRPCILARFKSQSEMNRFTYTHTHTHTHTYTYIYTHSLFLLFAAIMFYNISINTALANTRPLLLGKHKVRFLWDSWHNSSINWLIHALLDMHFCFKDNLFNICCWLLNTEHTTNSSITQAWTKLI